MTRNARIKSLYLTAVASLLFIGSANVDAASWRVGIAKATVTPATPVWLAGYGSKRVPDGKLHDLWVKETAWYWSPATFKAFPSNSAIVSLRNCSKSFLYNDSR